MGWFGEQIKERRKIESENFDDVMQEIASVINRNKTAFLDKAGDIKEKSMLSSLNQIFQYYQLKTIQELPINIGDLEDQLECTCRPYGIMRRNVKLEKGWYKDATGAFLAFKNDGTIVALLPNQFWGYSYYDVQTGKKVKINAFTEKELKEDAIFFYKPFPAKTMSTYDLISYAVKCVPKSCFLLFAITLVVAAGLNMIMPEITHIIFRQILPAGNYRMLYAISIFALNVVISGWLIGIIKDLAGARIGTEMGMHVQSAAMARVLSLSPEFFKNHSAGEMTTKIKHFNSFSNMLYTSVSSIVLTILFTLIYVIQILKYTPTLLAPALCAIILTLFSLIMNTYVRMKIKRIAMKDEEVKNGFTYSLLLGIQKIKLSGAEKRTFTKWTKLYTNEVKNTYGIPSSVLLGGTFNLAISLVSTLVMYYLAVKSGVSVADYYAFSTAYGMLSGMFVSMAGVGIQMANIMPTINSIKPIMDAVPEISQEKSIVTSLKGEIDLNHISFRYGENMPWVLDDISLEIKPGQYVAIVGESGCGKSTLLRIMLGFEKPRKGAVLYDDKDIESLDLKSLRRKIGVVLQNGKLFRGDIFSNISISAPGLTLKEAWKAAELADIANDIREMPMGMATIITEGGGGISGGQRQRLMIARAIASKPKILMFDEATSALDNISQKKISQALDGLNCTRIVIAHRLSTIKNCDRIIVLDKGKIVEDGDFETLLEKNGLFAELVNRQMLEKDF